MPTDPEGPNRLTTAGEADPYTEDALARHYEYGDGVRQLPVAGPPGTPPVFIRTHGGVGQKTVRYSAERVGGRAELPRPVPLGGNEVRLGWGVMPEAPGLTAEGINAVYEASMGVRYGFVLFPTAGPFRMGRRPHANLPAAGNLVSQGDFKADVL